MAFNPLPKKGASGTLYLYQTPQGDWTVVTWSGGRYHCHGQRDSLDEIKDYADTLLWAKSWPRKEVHSPTKKVSPVVRVEFEYADGRIQQLTGEHAAAWMENVNTIVGMSELRYGSPQMEDYPWKFFNKEE